MHFSREKSPLILNLPEGNQCHIQKQTHPYAPYVSAHWQESTLYILLGTTRVMLTLRHKNSLLEAAGAAGRMLTEHEKLPQPFAVYLVLAYLALCQNLPSPLQLDMMVRVAEPADGKIPLSNDSLSLRDIRHIVSEGFASLGQETVPLPAGLWNTARGLITTGQTLWQLRGDQAAHWGSYPSISTSLPNTAQQQRMQFAALAAVVATREQLDSLPLPTAPNARAEQVWLDYISLAAGEGTPSAELCSKGLGEVGDSALENTSDPTQRALSVEHGNALWDIAAAVLAASSDRPARYITRVLEIDIPHHLLPQLRVWDIEHLVIQVERTGMYVSVRDQTGRTMASAWWKADATSAYRTPLSFTPASWTVLHAVYSSVWHDLREEGIILDRADSLTNPTSSPQKKQRHQHAGKSSSQKRKIYLPPVRVKAKWASDSDRHTLATVTAGGHEYRRLPAGWEERERTGAELHQRDGRLPSILRRREEAAQRAIANRKLPPPPGWTYVAPFFRGGKPNEQITHTIPEVRARGLFSLVLGLQANAIQPLTMNFDER